MKYNQLKSKPKTKPTRVGRGISAGRGKTAGRGTKGQNSRSGNSAGRKGYSGRKDAIMARIPKLPGFTSHRKPMQIIYSGQLDAIEAKEIDNDSLLQAGLIKDAFYPTKLILKGKITKAKTVSLQAASQGAIEELQKAGGSFNKTDRPKKASQKKSD